VPKGRWEEREFYGIEDKLEETKTEAAVEEVQQEKKEEVN